MAVLVVTGIGNKDTPRTESHFVGRFTVEARVRRGGQLRSGRRIRIAAHRAKTLFTGFFFFFSFFTAASASVLSMCASAALENRNLNASAIRFTKKKKKKKYQCQRNRCRCQRQSPLYCLILYFSPARSRPLRYLALASTEATTTTTKLPRCSSPPEEITRRRGSYAAVAVQPSVIRAGLRRIASGEHASRSPSFLTLAGGRAGAYKRNSC